MNTVSSTTNAVVAAKISFVMVLTDSARQIATAATRKMVMYILSLTLNILQDQNGERSNQGRHDHCDQLHEETAWSNCFRIVRVVYSTAFEVDEGRNQRG